MEEASKAEIAKQVKSKRKVDGGLVAAIVSPIALLIVAITLTLLGKPSGEIAPRDAIKASLSSIREKHAEAGFFSQYDNHLEIHGAAYSFSYHKDPFSLIDNGDSYRKDGESYYKGEDLIAADTVASIISTGYDFYHMFDWDYDFQRYDDVENDPIIEEISIIENEDWIIDLYEISGNGSLRFKASHAIGDALISSITVEYQNYILKEYSRLYPDDYSIAYEFVMY